MTTNLGKLAEFLRKHRPHALCDDCLSELVPITNRRQLPRFRWWYYGPRAEVRSAVHTPLMWKLSLMLLAQAAQ